VLAKRWRDAHGASRYERLMTQAELAGNHEMLLEWETRDVSEKQRRHDRVMDWIRSPLDLLRAIAVGFAATTMLLLGLGIVLALANKDIALVIAPIRRGDQRDRVHRVVPVRLRRHPPGERHGRVRGLPVAHRADRHQRTGVAALRC
jgi:hypothetical protein